MRVRERSLQIAVKRMKRYVWIIYLPRRQKHQRFREFRLLTTHTSSWRRTKIFAAKLAARPK